MKCQERLRLTVDYRETTRIYADCVREMTDLVELGIDAEVDLLYRTCRMAWAACERARLGLSRHELQHTCNQMGTNAARASDAANPNGVVNSTD